MRFIPKLTARVELPRLHAAAAGVEAADPATRQLSGMVLPYGVVGATSAGPIVVPGPGLVRVPPAELLGRVKLVDEHQDPPVSIGYATGARDTPEGLRGAFYVARTPAGDRAWGDYHEGTRDAFSVELVNVQLDDQDNLVAADLQAVAFVTFPAWSDARQDGLAASRRTTTTTTEGAPMLTAEQIQRLSELLAQDTYTDAEASELRELLAVANDMAGDPAGDPAGEDPPAGDPAGQAGQAGGAQAGQAVAASRRRHAALPGSLPGGQRRGQRRPELRELYASMARVFSGVSRPELEAALADVTSTANIWTSADEYSGQLWAGVDYQRRFVPLMSSGDLRSYKGSGWRWGVKPQVADYAGDKAAVPSNQPTTESADWVAARLAGAHDIDRKFVDFGDQDFIDAYYAAMRESYARQSDQKAQAFIVANATALGAAGAGMFRAAAVAAQAVEDAVGVPDYFLVNSADRLGLLNITQADVPAYLEAFGVTPDKFRTAPSVPAGTVIAGARQAAKFRELPGSPIRVEAINVAQGGVDGGVFGYYATELLAEGGIAAATFA